MPRAPRPAGGPVHGPWTARRPRSLAPARLPSAMLAALLAAAPTPPAAQTAPTAQDCPEHVVQPGDSLAALARSRGVEGGAQALLALNADRIADADSIRVGQSLRLPCPPTDPAEDAGASDAPTEAAARPAALSESAAAAPRVARLPTPRPADVAAATSPPAAAATPTPSAAEEDVSAAPLRTFEAREEVPGANPEADARLAAALAEAAPNRPVAESAPTPAPAPDAAGEGLADGRLSAYDLVYPWVRPDCDRLERLPPDLAARCTRYDFSAPLATARIAWFARADSPVLSARRPADLRGLTLCRPAGMFDGDLAAAGLAPPRAARLAPETARDCLDAVAGGEADVASLEARDARRARAQPPPLPDITELPALASRVTLHAAAWRGSTAGRAALAALNAGLAALRARQAPEEREEGDR